MPIRYLWGIPESEGCNWITWRILFPAPSHTKIWTTDREQWSPNLKYLSGAYFKCRLLFSSQNNNTLKFLIPAFLKAPWMILKISQVWELLGCGIWSQSKERIRTQRAYAPIEQAVAYHPLACFESKITQAFLHLGFEQNASAEHPLQKQHIQRSFTDGFTLIGKLFSVQVTSWVNLPPHHSTNYHDALLKSQGRAAPHLKEAVKLLVQWILILL